MWLNSNQIQAGVMWISSSKPIRSPYLCIWMQRSLGDRVTRCESLCSWMTYLEQSPSVICSGFRLGHEQEINLYCTESLKVCYTAGSLSWLIQGSSRLRWIKLKEGRQYKMQNHLDPIKSGVTLLPDWTIPNAKPSHHPSSSPALSTKSHIQYLECQALPS